MQRIALGAILAVGLIGCGRPAPIAPTTEIVPAESTTTAAATELPPPTWGPTDWPAWRGPNHDGVATGPAVPVEWTDTKNVTWKVNLPGRGHSSPIVLGDRLYLETADEKSQVQAVLAIDRTRGKLIWQTDLFTGKFEQAMHGENTQASSTLATDGERLFALFLNDRRIWCSALTLEGQELWRKEVGGFQSKFGYSASPMVYQSLVILAADHADGGFIAALHRGTGDIVWRRNRPRGSSYASPRVVTLGGVDQVVLSGCETVSAYDPLTGKDLWSTKGTTEATVGTPVVAGELVIVSGGYPGSDTVALKSDGSVAWRVNDKCYVPSQVVHQGHLYAVQDDGIARCWEAATGKERWKQRIGGRFRTSPLVSGDNVYITDMAGKTTVFRANPEKYELVAENQLGTEGFSSPAVSAGQLFLRVPDDSRGGRQEVLYCIGQPALANGAR